MDPIEKGKRLQQARRIAGYSSVEKLSDDLGDVEGLSAQTLRRIEQGKRSLKRHEADLLADLFTSSFSR